MDAGDPLDGAVSSVDWPRNGQAVGEQLALPGLMEELFLAAGDSLETIMSGHPWMERGAVPPTPALRERADFPLLVRGAIRRRQEAAPPPTDSSSRP